MSGGRVAWAGRACRLARSGTDLESKNSRVPLMQSSHVARWQAAMVGCAVLLLGMVMRFADAGAPTAALFRLLLVGVPMGLACLALLGIRKDSRHWSAHLLSTLGLGAVWLYAAFFLWANTYGT